MTQAANLTGTYTYNGFEQLIGRVVTNSGTANGTTFFVHDQWGNVIAELNSTGATVREYIWLPEAEISPTRQSRTQVDIPVAVVDAVNTATPVLLMVHVDQLGRPIRMTDSLKASVWDVQYTPWGAPHAITGAQTLNARFPGQWFQLESSLAYNWHRHYDASIGRYTQPDPLGFVDGPGVYGYGRGSALIHPDQNGLQIAIPAPHPAFWIIPPIAYYCYKAIKNYSSAPPAAANDNSEIPDKYCKAQSLEGTKLLTGRIRCTYDCPDGTVRQTTVSSVDGCRPIVRMTSF